MINVKGFLSRISRGLRRIVVPKRKNGRYLWRALRRVEDLSIDDINEWVRVVRDNCPEIFNKIMAHYSDPKFLLTFPKLSITLTKYRQTQEGETHAGEAPPNPIHRTDADSNTTEDGDIVRMLDNVEALPLGEIEEWLSVLREENSDLWKTLARLKRENPYFPLLFSKLTIAMARAGRLSRKTEEPHEAPRHEARTIVDMRTIRRIYRGLVEEFGVLKLREPSDVKSIVSRESDILFRNVVFWLTKILPNADALVDAAPSIFMREKPLPQGVDLPPPEFIRPQSEAFWFWVREFFIEVLENLNKEYYLRKGVSIANLYRVSLEWVRLKGAEPDFSIPPEGVPRLAMAMAVSLPPIILNERTYRTRVLEQPRLTTYLVLKGDLIESSFERIIEYESSRARAFGWGSYEEMAKNSEPFISAWLIWGLMKLHEGLGSNAVENLVLFLNILRERYREYYDAWIRGFFTVDHFAKNLTGAELEKIPFGREVWRVILTVLSKLGGI